MRNNNKKQKLSQNMMAIGTVILLSITLVLRNNRMVSKYLSDSGVKRYNAVATVIHNDEMMNSFCITLQSISRNDIIDPSSFIIIFHARHLPMYKKYNLIKCSKYPVNFHWVQFRMPEELLEYKGRPPMDAETFHTVRFWTTYLWDQPFVREFETLMRIDPYSCFRAKDWDGSYRSLPALPSNRYVYRSDGPHKPHFRSAIEEIENSSDNNDNNKQQQQNHGGGHGRLLNFAQNFMSKEQMHPQNPELWDHLRYAFNKDKVLPVFRTDFEVLRVSFFRRADVRKWQAALAEEVPRRMYQLRWMDDEIRIVTMAMFAKKDELLLKKHEGFLVGKSECTETMGLFGALASGEAVSRRDLPSEG